MKLASALMMSLALVLLVPSIDFAQTRRRTTTRRPTASARARRPTAASTTTLNEARIRLTDEVKVLTRFLYLYGRTSVGVESNEQQARQGGELPPQAAAIVNRSRAAIQQSVGDIRDRLDKLALYFRTTPGLDQYSQRLTEISATAATAERQATAGQLDAAGRTLIETANQLTDVLLEI